MNLSDGFDRTFVLNLPEREDRRREMSQVLRDAGMAWEPGKLELFTATRPASAGTFPSLGAHGCFLSHLGMLEKARELGVSRLLVMEDDLDLAPEISEAAGLVADRLAGDDWGFAYLGHQLPAEGPAGPPGTLVPHVGEIRTTHFYAIHGQVLDRVIAYLELVRSRPPGHPDGGPMHVDGAFSFFRDRNPDVTTLVARPNLGWQRSSSSDISSHWADRWPGARGLLRVARRVKRRFVPPPR